MSSARILQKVLLLTLLLTLAAVAVAQSPQGRILGRVTDASGAVLPKAQVTVTNLETGVSRVLVTTAAGDYAAPNLNPGLYSVTAEVPRFQKVQRTGIRLEVATDLRIDFALKPGQVNEVVQVSGEAPLVDTVSETLGGTLTNKAINELPLQGRDFQNLLALRPGVQRIPGGGMLSITSNGNRTTANNFMVDGTDDNDIYYGDTVVNGAGVMGTPASHLPLDAIQEFNTQQNQGAEYGWKPGAVVNIGLKSGTNTLHGTTYYFNRNSALDARNYFNPAVDELGVHHPVTALNLHQFGGSLGGPIKKDKWFYFGSYEGVRHKVGNDWNVASPVTGSLLAKGYSSSTALKYSLVDAKNACTTAGNCNPLSLQIANLFLTNPGGTVPGSDPSLINFGFNNQNREDNLIFKTDYQVNSKHTLSGRYIYTNSHQVEEDTSPLRPEFLSYADTRTTVAGLTLTSTPTSKWVNNLRFGINRMWQQIDSVDHLLGDPAKVWGINTGIKDPRLYGMPSISVSPFDYLGGNYNWPLATTPNSTLVFSDNASYVHGAHNLQFGGEFRYGLSNNFREQYGKGRVEFRSLANFMNGTVRRGYLLNGDTTRNVSMRAFGGFITDDWRLSRKLVVTLGLRYDLSLPIHEAHDLLANFIPTGPTIGIVQVGHGIGAPYATNKANWSPRAGFAYDLKGDGKTVFRSGMSLIYEQPTMRMFVDRDGLHLNPSGATLDSGALGSVKGSGTITTFRRTLSASAIKWSLAGPLFDTTSTAAMTCSPDSPCDVVGVNRNIKTPRVLSWNANLQRQVTRTTAVQVAYVGSKGIDLYSHRDINQVDPLVDDGSEQFGRPFTYNCSAPVGAGKGGPCFPYLRFVKYIENLGNSDYHSMQVTVTQKAWRGMDFLAGYTWAHAIDNNSTDRNTAWGFPQDASNINAERGNGDYDIRHRFTLSLTYNLPKFKAPLQFGEGWQFTSIAMLEGGMPYNFYDTYNDISATYTYGYERWNFAGNPGDVNLTQRGGIPYFPGSSFGPGADGTDSPGGVINNAACLAHASLSQLENYGCYVQGSAVITPQAPYTFGNMGRNIFRGPGFQNWDLSVTKVWRLSERFKVQARGEFFNILNHPNFALSSANFDLGTADQSVGRLTATPDVYAANPVIGSGGSRHIQLGLKVIW